MGGLWRDTRVAIRSLLRNRGLTTVIVLCLGIGIGASTGIVAVVSAVILRVPPLVRDPSGLFRVHVTRRAGNLQTEASASLSYPDFIDLSATRHIFADLAAFATVDLDFARGEDARRLHGILVTARYFSLLGVHPAVGRFFSAEETTSRALSRVVVLSHAFWLRQFLGDSAVIGKTVTCAGLDFVVIGVAPGDFAGVDPGAVDIWVPMAAANDVMPGFPWLEARFASWLGIVGRLFPGVSKSAATLAASSALAQAAQSVEGLDKHPSVLFGPLSMMLGPGRGAASTAVLWLTIAAGLVLLIALANVGILLLARAMQRRREIAIRVCLGITKWALIRQLVVESVFLTVFGGTVGVAIAYLTIRAPLFPSGFPRTTISLDQRALGFATFVSVFTGVLFGLIPAVIWLRKEITADLKIGGNQSGRNYSRQQDRLVAFQVALMVILLTNAALLMRSLRNLQSVDPGIEINRLLLASVDLERAGYSAAAQEAFYSRALDRLRHLPGVQAASVALSVPFRDVQATTVRAVGSDQPRQPPIGPYLNYVGADYFTTVGTRVLSGRSFTATDFRDDGSAVVINKAMADLWPNQSAVGKCISVGPQQKVGQCTRVIAVVETGKYLQLQEAPIPFIFLPLKDDSVQGIPTLFVRVVGNPSASVEYLRRQVAALAPNLPFVDVETVESIVAPQLRDNRAAATFLSLFAGMAIILAAVGLYGTVSYRMTKRRRDIGIRLAVGAQSSRIVKLIVFHELRLAAVGFLVGVCCALATSWFLRSLLYGLTPLDSGTYGIVSVVVFVVVVTACYVPARRVGLVNPATALRAE